MLLKLKKLQKSYFIIIAVVIIVLLFLVVYCFEDEDNHSNVAVITITGQIISSPTYNSDGSIDKSNAVSINIVNEIRKADKDKRVKAIAFIINSSGGDTASAQEITRAIKETHKPTVSLIRTFGDSSAYWIASATGRIFALPVSDVGSIGVTISYLDNTAKNKNDGLTFNKLSYGKYKDMLNPDKPLTPEEEKLVMAQVNEVAQIFIKEVAENRHLPVEKVQSMADGSSIIAQDALKLGLVDQIGSFADVDRYLSKILKKNIHINILGYDKEEE